MRVKAIIRLVFIVTLFLNGGVYAQDLAFDHLTVQNGLSNNAVLSITQDQQGFMWFGTAIGLNRYDGSRFKTYKSIAGDSNSISNSGVNAVLCDSSGTVWIGTAVGLNRYNPRADNFSQISFPSGTPSSNTVFSLYTDREKMLWVGTGNGLYLFNRASGRFKRFLAPDSLLHAGAAVRSLYEDSHGSFWIGTNAGLIRMNGSIARPEDEVYRHLNGDPLTVSSDFIMTIGEDEQGNIWIGTQGGGTSIYNPQTNKFQSPEFALTNKNVRKIMRDAAGRVWVGTQEGIHLVEPAAKKSQLYRHDAGKRNSLSQNSVYSIYEDRNRTIWIGTYFGGINALYPIRTAFSVWQNNENANSISNNVVSSMVEDRGGNLWIGTEGGGLNRYDPAQKIFHAYLSETGDKNTIGSNLVKVVYIDHDGNIWAGTHGGGLNVLEEKTGKFRRFVFTGISDATLNSEVVSLLEDFQGRFWVGTNYGLKLFKRVGRELFADGSILITAELNNNLIRSIIPDSKEGIWIGTNNGLFRFEKGKFTKFSNEAINCLYQDLHGVIWAGINYGGLLKIDVKMQRWTEKEGLPNNNVIGILADKQENLWLSTDNGLIKFNQQKNTFRVYSVNDGIADNAFNYNSFLRTRDNHFFFGGYNGITVFDPSSVEINVYSSPIVFTGVKLAGDIVRVGDASNILSEDIAFTKELRFQHGQDVFTLEFSLLNFIRSSRNLYAYKLEGFDKNWIETTQPSVTFTNLASGNYKLLVRGANSDGVWSEPALLTIKVLPPFWLTWWAYTIYGLLAVGVIFLITRYIFLRALLKKEEELHQVKLNFFTNISHEIRTHLTLIMVPLERLLDKGKLQSSEKQQLTQAKQNADHLLKLVSELMDFRKAETENPELHLVNNEVPDFLEGIMANFRAAAKVKSLRLDLHIDESIPAIAFDRDQMEKVISNLLSNAIKFTQEGGMVVMKAVQQEGRIIISVEDDGKGISKENLQKIFNNYFQVAEHGAQNTGYGIGLALSKKIVELHGGSISVESSQAEKTVTTFIVSLPLKTIAGENVVRSPVPEFITPDFEEEAVEIPDGSQSQTILLIEDNPELRRLMYDTFSANYRVVQGEDGEQGWEMAITELPDIIISDVMMPGMDGFELCAKLKTDERSSHIPVILLTARSTQDDQLAGLNYGADVYLTKPFNTRMLELNVRNLLALKEKMRIQFSRQIAAELSAPVETESNPFDDEFVQKVVALVDEHMDNPDFGVDMLAKKVAMSQPVLYKKLKAVTNMSVNDFVKTLRLKKASQLLRSKKYTVYEVAYAVGFADRKYFSREFKKQFGVSPSEYGE